MRNLKTILTGSAAAVAFLCACNSAPEVQLTKSGINPADFDTCIAVAYDAENAKFMAADPAEAKQVKLYTLTNKNGMEVCITNFGGRIVSIMVPNKDGELVDVACGFDKIENYFPWNFETDFGCSVGRYANRINQGKITVDGKEYQLPQNNFGHCLHGGPTGWMYQVYDAELANDSTLKMTIVSPDGDNNFPGTVTATTTYVIKSDNTLDITWEATTDKETIINQTNHSYFNLNGDPSKPGMNMVLYVNADNYTPADETYMTTGEIAPVEGTPMDFRKAHAIEETIVDTTFQQIKNASGYDHNWCLNTYKDGKGDDTQVCASLYSPVTGIFREMFTNEPGVQVYTGNFQGTGISCKHGIKYPKQVSVCLESQKYPDSPNKKDWPQPYLKPGEKYYSHCAYRFSVK